MTWPLDANAPVIRYSTVTPSERSCGAYAWSIAAVPRPAPPSVTPVKPVIDAGSIVAPVAAGNGTSIPSASVANDGVWPP